MGTDLKSVLITKEEIDAKLAELAATIDEEYAGKDLLLVGVLKGAVMVMADLARTAQLSRDDADALDSWAADADASVRDESGLLDCAKLYALPPAVRRRVLRRAVIQAGAPAGSLFARHVEEVDRLITGWRGQRAINLPGRVEARRQGGRLVIRQG